MKIGVTGGIGSGKSTVCRIFNTLGIPIYDADSKAKQLMYRNKTLKKSIKILLGDKAYHRNGRPNKKYIASKIFTDKSLLAGVNNLVHPAVARDSQIWHEKQHSPYTIKEAALLVENGSYKLLDRLIVVTAPESTRISRVINRDKISEEAVLKRIKNQLPETAKIKVADYIIDNSGDDSLIRQVWKIHQSLLKIIK